MHNHNNYEKKILEQIGLSEEQAKVYSCLINKGVLSARKISTETGITRSLIYKIIKQLIVLELVSEYDYDGKISKFNALPPANLQKIVDKQKEETSLATNALSEAMSTLGAQFNLLCGKPSVRFYEGMEGIKILNQDIIYTEVDVKIVRSPLDNDNDELESKAKKLLSDRAEKGIKTKLIVPIKNTPSSITQQWDNDYNIERRRVPREDLLNPAQIIIYGNKVAFTSFNDCMITTIIEDINIRKTMDMLFDSLWEKYSK